MISGGVSPLKTAPVIFLDCLVFQILSHRTYSAMKKLIQVSSSVKGNKGISGMLKIHAIYNVVLYIVLALKCDITVCLFLKCLFKNI